MEVQCSPHWVEREVNRDLVSDTHTMNITNRKDISVAYTINTAILHDKSLL